MIHILDHGSTLCNEMFDPNNPRKWPRGHVWVGKGSLPLDDMKGHEFCPECKAAFDKLKPPQPEDEGKP